MDLGPKLNDHLVFSADRHSEDQEREWKTLKLNVKGIGCEGGRWMELV
jgi:hypothetical protein